MKSIQYSLPLALALAATLAAAPADAQGNGRGNGRGNSVERRDDDRDRDRDRDRRVRDRDDDRWEEPRFERRSTRRVPPGWCIGRGNPHNTPENCGYNRNGGVYRDRNGNVIYNRDGVYGGGSGSYDRAHQEFHYQHDRRCRELARQRPLDPIYQVRISRQCAEEHQAFHRQWGIPHR